MRDDKEGNKPAPDSPARHGGEAAMGTTAAIPVRSPSDPRDSRGLMQEPTHADIEAEIDRIRMTQPHLREDAAKAAVRRLYPRGGEFATNITAALWLKRAEHAA